eukprot:1155982-Amphidinium_carterae.1
MSIEVLVSVTEPAQSSAEEEMKAREEEQAISREQMAMLSEEMRPAQACKEQSSSLKGFWALLLHNNLVFMTPRRHVAEENGP